MGGIGTEKTAQKRGLTILIIVNALFLLLALFRAMFCIATADEAFNIGQALRTIQGNQYLVENWDYFQTGDSFLTPFLFVYCKITGSTEGIILFSRIVFIVLQLLLSVFIYKILSLFFDRRASAFAVFIVATAVQLFLFNMWYDTWEVFFRLIGLFLIFYVISSFNKLSCKKALLLVFLAGVSHACMVYAYPTMILVYLSVAVLLFVYKRKQSAKMHNLYVLFYLLGAVFVFLIFVAYVLKIGYKNLFVFNEVISKAGLASTGREGFFSPSSLITNTKLLFTNNLKCYSAAMVVYVLCILVLLLLKTNQKRVPVILISMVLGSLLLLRYKVTTTLNTSFLMTYLSFYVPPLYLMIRKDSDRSGHYKDLIAIVMISCYVSGIVYAYTAMYGAYKFACGTRPCAIIAILLTCELLKQNSSEKISKTVFSVLASALVAFNVFYMYSYSYEGTAPYKCTSQIRSGIFKGLFETPETAQRYETIQRDFPGSCRETDKTITCGPYAMEFYLMSDLKPNAANLWDPKNTDLLFKYYENYYGEPDMIVLHDSAAKFTPQAFLDFVAEKYQLTEHTDHFLIYHRKT